MDCSVALLTLRTKAVDVAPFIVAVMLVEPALLAVAMPAELIVATVGADEAHVTELVMFRVLPSLKPPVAVNCSVPPTINELCGAKIVIVCNDAAVTVS